MTLSCDVLSEAHNGCKIENSQCICSFGCKSEYRYSTKKECTDALKVCKESLHMNTSAVVCFMFNAFITSFYLDECMNASLCLVTAVLETN